MHIIMPLIIAYYLVRDKKKYISFIYKRYGMKYLQCSSMNRGDGGCKKPSRFKHERAIKRRQGKHTL